VTLEADTALEPAGEGRWRAEISEGWWIQRGPYGGYISALLMRAAVAAVADGQRPPRSFTAHFIDAPVAGPAELTATVERAGRSSTALSLRMEQDGKPVALALAGFGQWRDGEPEWIDTQAPDAPAPEDCPPVKRVEGMPRFIDRLEVRWVDGGSPGHGGEHARNLAWVRLAEGGPLDLAAVTALSDTWMPAAFSKLGRFAIVPTFDLTIHYRAPLPAAGEWLLADYHSRVSAGGAWDEDGELWAQDGTLVAQSRQLAMMREPR
jgi:acyl-CoA thioesterase